MKKHMIIVVLVICIYMVCGCGKENTEVIVPEEEQIKKICELSTLECEFNNVAHGVQTKGTGFTHLGEKDRKYWLEYTGVVKLGIDMSKVSMKIREDKVTITMPPAEIQYIGIRDDSYTEESIITSEDSFFNKNKITVEEQQKAIASAQEAMEEKILKNEALMTKAQDRAKILIENYINNIGKTSGITYTIKWKYVD